MFPYCLPLCLLLFVQGFHPCDPSVWVKGARLIFFQGGTKIFLNFLPFLAITQEMISATIVALDPLLSSPLGLFPPKPEPPLPFLGCYFFTIWATWTVPPEQLPSTCGTLYFFLFLIFKSLGYFSSSACLGPISTMDLQMPGHGNGSLQIAMHMGAHMFL